MYKKLLLAMPLALSILLSGCSGETEQDDKRPVEDTENDIEDKDFKLDKEESDGDKN